MLWRTSADEHARQVLRSTSGEVSAALASDLRRETDFLSTLRAIVSMQPHISERSFLQWYEALEPRHGDLGTVATAVIAVVPARELASFQRRRFSEPSFRALAGTSRQIIPAGRRSRYCLLSAGFSKLQRAPLVQLVGHLDWCTNTVAGLGSALAAAARTGEVVVTPEAVGTTFIGSAVYRQGAPVATAAQRQAATIGWVWSSFDVQALLNSVIGSEHKTSVSLYHRDPGEGLTKIGSAGSAPRAALADSFALDGSGAWRLEVRGVPGLGGGVIAAGPWVVVLVLGVVASMLVSALALALLSSRQRAFALVAETTGKLRHQALHDSLTGLPNRVLALGRAEQMLDRARELGGQVAALYVDLDGFKHVNDTFGHATGDELLVIAAGRLRSVVREGDTAARLGGDEFVVLLDCRQLRSGPVPIAKRMLEVLRQPYALSGEGARRLSLTASIGIAVGTRPSAEELLRDADVALYEAKAAGRDRYVLFEAAMQTAVQDRLTLEMDLSEALLRGELRLVYQPTVELGSGRIVAAEALLRWAHPERGLVEPAEFVPIAEQSGLIVPIGRWVLEQACAQAADWHRRGHRIGIAVNLSARQIDRRALVDEVRTALDGSGLDPSSLTLEVTETTIMREARLSAHRLRALKDLGVRLAIDDFGTGYSSLAYLRQFPVNTLKIDRSFVAGMTSSKESAALVRTLVQLGRTLELETLAEGIEQPAQLEALRREGCRYGQGFLFAMPLPAAALEAMLQSEAVRLRGEDAQRTLRV